MEKSQTEIDKLERLEKSEDKIDQPAVIASEHKRTSDQKVTTNDGQNVTQEPSTTSPETEPCNPKTCYLVARSSPVTIDHCVDGISSDVPPSTAHQTQMSIIKVATINSKDQPVIICCLAAKEKLPTSSTLKNNTSESQTSQDNSTQGTGRVLPKIIYHTPKSQLPDTAPAGNQLSTITESDNEPLENLSKTSTIQATVPHQREISQIDNQMLQFQWKRNTIKQSAFKFVSKLDTAGNCYLETDSTTIKNRCENGQTNSPFTSRNLPFQDQSCANPTLKQSPVKSCYTGSWDPLCHHMCDHEKSIALPHDLRCLKESELLPMAYGDFTKCLEEDQFCCPTEMTALADDDSVVPLSSLLPGADTRCNTTCSDASTTDGSQENSCECFSAHNENIYQSPSLSYDYPQYGTLNWGLTPTIIYKTPDSKSSLNDVGDDYMKCSISEGNVELLTPPPPNYKKLLRRSRRRNERRHVKRRIIYFGNDEDYEGLQEVPVNESQKDSETSLDTDFVPDDPMWFENEEENVLPDKEDEPISISEQDIVDCCEYFGNVSPTSEETISTYKILTEAVEYIKNLEETLNDFNTDREENVKVIEDESDKCNELNRSCEAALGILPLLDETDEPPYEIEEILDNLDPREEASLNGCEVAPSADLSVDGENNSKRKRKYQKSTNKKRKTPRKQKKSDGNSSSQRSDCDTVPLSEHKIRSNSSSRYNSQGSRCVTPILPKPTTGVLVSPTVTRFIPLQTIGKPLILPKPPHQEGYFSPPTSPLLSALASPQLPPKMTQTLPTWLGSGQVVKEPATKCRGKAKRKERPVEEKRKSRQKSLQKKTIPNGYMLYCKEKRNRALKANPDLKSKPGDITKLLSEKWNQLSEEEQRPYMGEAMKLRFDENKWINSTP